MAHVVCAADELGEGDRIMWNVDILTIKRVTLGRVIRTGIRFAFAYFEDGTSIGFTENDCWYTTVINYEA